MLLLLTGIAVADALSPQLVLSPFLVVPVLLASSFASARAAASVAGLAIVTAALLGLPNGEFTTADNAIRTLAVAVVSVFAVYVTRERETREEALRRAGLHDSLTGLPNRRLLVDRLRQVTLRRSSAGVLGVFFVDLDGFKSINDTFGHNVGDEALRYTAECLKTATRAGDTLARYAGDEFVLLCPDMRDASEAGRIAERMRASLSRPLVVDSHTVEVTASIGVAIGGGGSGDEQSLLHAADEAMFVAKRRGGHGYVVTQLSPPGTSQCGEG